MTAEMNDFWWQVSWRAPDIETGTTLLAEYPSVAVSEDYILWGPANLIYRPNAQSQIPIEIELPAAVLTDEVVLNVINNQKRGEIHNERIGYQPGEIYSFGITYVLEYM